jgi:hypothetical protein
MKRSLTHAASIGGQAASKVEAVALAEAMSDRRWTTQADNQ